MAEDRPEDLDEPTPADEERPRTGIRRRLGRLLNQRELAEDTREVFTGVLEMSDRAKTEAVRLVAREARNYLDELKIKEDLLDLMTSHSLEVQLSVHLKPLADTARALAKDTEEEPAPAPTRRRKTKAKAEPQPLDAAEPDEDLPEDPDDGQVQPDDEAE